MRFGMQVASIGVRVALPPLFTLGCALLAGCVVSNTIDFVPEENFPPSIQAVPGAVPALNEIIVAEAGMSSVSFEVDVVDPNLDQELFWIATINGIEFQGQGVIDATGTLTRRLEFTVTFTPSPNSCFAVELLVSSDFNGFTPQEPGDLGTAVWWVLIPDDDGEIDANLCPGSRS